jgi:hypothetical protein
MFLIGGKLREIIEDDTGKRHSGPDLGNMGDVVCEPSDEPT